MIEINFHGPIYIAYILRYEKKKIKKISSQKYRWAPRNNTHMAIVNLGTLLGYGFLAFNWSIISLVMCKTAVLKLWLLAMPETCENWLGPVNSCVYYACHTPDYFKVLPYSVDFKAFAELWNPLSKTMFSKCSFIWNKGPVGIWNDGTAEK